MTIKVKPLVWKDRQAESIVGTYRAGYNGEDWWVFLNDTIISRGDSTSPSDAVQQVKAAAQAHHEAAIRSQIEEVSPAAIRAEALREARQLVGCWGGEEGPDAIATPEEPYTKGFLAAIFHAQAQIDALIDKEQDHG